MTDTKCPRCGGKMKMKNGKYGSFLGCSQYPRCRCTISVRTNGTLAETARESWVEYQKRKQQRLEVENDQETNKG